MGVRIALVPTMGALHAGHLSLVRIATAQADRVIVSIFVNPKQFAPHEDFARYPRTLDADLEALAAARADLVYIPDGDSMYPEGFATTVSVAGAARGLESDSRPHFFDGVATVVTKLLVRCAPDLAVFGEKDYQQLQVVRRLVADLDLPVEIIGGAIVREPDGLALSSRNRYLSPEERIVAASLNRRLAEAEQAVEGGAGIPETLARCRKAWLEDGFTKIDYVELRDAATLEPLARLDRPARLLAAAWLGATRLIDNRPVSARGR